MFGTGIKSDPASHFLIFSSSRALVVPVISVVTVVPVVSPSFFRAVPSDLGTGALAGIVRGRGTPGIRLHRALPCAGLSSAFSRWIYLYYTLSPFLPVISVIPSFFRHFSVVPVAPSLHFSVSRDCRCYPVSSFLYFPLHSLFQLVFLPKRRSVPFGSI